MVVASADSSLVIMERLCAKLPWVIMTPLGSLVDPDVYCKKAKSDEEHGDDVDVDVDETVAILVLFWSVTIHWRASGHDALAFAVLFAEVFRVKASRIPAIFLA
jgi:hypothetical protein